MGFECNICFEEKKISHQYKLSCCKGYTLCQDCASQFKKPECPFCRTFLRDLDCLVIHDEEKSYSSRIYRRKQKQLSKLQQRQENYLKNLYGQQRFFKTKQKTIRQNLKKKIKNELVDFISF